LPYQTYSKNYTYIDCASVPLKTTYRDAPTETTSTSLVPGRTADGARRVECERVRSCRAGSENQRIVLAAPSHQGLPCSSRLTVVVRPRFRVVARRWSGPLASPCQFFTGRSTLLMGGRMGGDATSPDKRKDGASDGPRVADASNVRRRRVRTALSLCGIRLSPITGIKVGLQQVRDRTLGGPL
jgi:hypothetical protein